MAKRYGAETVRGIMSKNVPTCRPDDTQDAMMSIVSSHNWTSVHSVYVVDKSGKLEGLIHIDKLLRSARNKTAGELMVRAEVVLRPGDDQERAVFEAIKNDIIAIPVAERDGTFLGAVTAWSIIDVMHDEHVEDSLLMAGVRKGVTRAFQDTSRRSAMIVRSRAPWLIFGLVMGMLLALISSMFEEALQKSVAIAYFIPVIAYIAGAVGTQSGAITIRALATIKLKSGLYVLKEFVVGAGLGVFVGVLGALGAAVIGQSLTVGLVVGLSLFAACVVSTVLAAIIPIGFKKFGRDPALGSGPLATALQDIASILVYFGFASLLI